MQYFTSASRSGRVRYGALACQIDVIKSRTVSQKVGEATEIGITMHGLAIWRLHIHGAYVPGLWLIIDGQFVLFEEVLG